MFDRNNFKYDEESHKGFYRGVLVPSVTQLIECLYPLDDDIPEERLTNAAKRGTTIHNEIAEINEIINRHILPFDKASQSSEEVKDYVAFINAYHLTPLRFEEMVFLLDEDKELICYGTYDLILGAYQDIEPFKAQKCYLFDIKTTSVFNKPKTALQTQIYRVAFKQMFPNLEIEDETFGLHIRDGIKVIPLKAESDDYIIRECKMLRGIWNEQNK